MPLILDSPPTSPNRTTSSATSFSRRFLHHTADVLIVGAGILGCALAITLARQGRSVLLLEKSLKEPDRIVGELLQPGGVSALEKLGLRACLEQIDAVVVRGYEVIYYGEGVHIPYPEKDSGRKRDPVKSGLAKVRPEGRSFHHGRFIRRLREAAMRECNISVVETTVTALVKTTYSGQVLGVECQTQGCADVYFADLTVIADGYASRFRKEFLPHAPTSRSKFWGLELLDADLPRSQHGHVVLGDGPPVLLYQIGTRETRVLVDVPNDLASANPAHGGIKAHLRDVVLPSLPPRVQPSFAKALDAGRLRSMPNSFLPPSPQQVPGVIFLGDAMNMRHPLTGGGMTVAFNDVVLLRDLLSPEKVPDLGDVKRVQKAMKIFHWRRKNLSAVINILAMALYDLFAANDPLLRVLQLGCFRYFQRGGACVDGPVGLLAGIIRQPLVLFYHFFAVALLGIYILLGDAASGGVAGAPKAGTRPTGEGNGDEDGKRSEAGLGIDLPSPSSSPSSSPWWKRMAMMLLALVGAGRVFWKACEVLFPVVWTEVRW